MTETFLSRLGRLFTTAEMKKAYQLVFRTTAGERFVLPDLAEFTHALEPAPRDSDLFVQGRAAGRRDVWLHINNHLHLTEEALAAVYMAHALPSQPRRENG